MRERAARLQASARLRFSLARLEEDLAERDPFPFMLFVGSFSTYWAIGELIQGFHGHDVYNYFFNADCPRIVSDLTRAHRESSSGIAASSVHPLFLVLWNPIAAPLSWLLGGDDLLASLVLSHAVAAGANVLAYVALRKVEVPRVVAIVAASCLALSTTQLVFGSIVETYAFAALSLLACLVVSLSTTRPEPSAIASIVPFGVNVVLAPYSFFAAPVVWIGRLRFREWLAHTAVLVVLLFAVALALLKVQHDRYPDTNFFHRSYFEGYLVYSEQPRDFARYVHRWVRLVPHVFSFDVVAPVSLFTGNPDKITTFMWEQRDRVAGYSPLGGTVAVVWLASFFLATAGNLRGMFRGDRRRLGLRLLCAGWLVGVLGLFTFFGDDLMLYSELWVGHVVLFVALGLAELVRGEHLRFWKAAGAIFLTLLAWNNARFVFEMLGRYQT